MSLYDMNSKTMRVGFIENGDAYKGVSMAAEGAPVDMAIIQIEGRYPSEGEWAVNHEVHEMVHVTRGFGSVAVRGAQMQELRAGDTVHVAPGLYFAWDGHMELAMACSPPFSPGQYEVVKEGNDEV